ncbi:beta-mannosidase [Winogradskyella aurantiaca]|uniref:beta-mannosidase n=1 Tax=Winogradskyella aurantiaca TaxID=2219558 RepID=UPI000E1E2760|nr:glycoside hydrolase family 2 protein [Winogradskyella aurantiaca]
MRYSCWLIILLILGCETKYDLPITIELNDNWEFRQQGDSLWRTATVPGNVFTDLMDHQLIKDPFVGTNEDEVQWVSEANWEYRTNFSLSEELLQKKDIELNFKGLDTYASVYLNDSLILNSNNAFRSWKLQPQALLKTNNELLVVLESPFKNEAIAKNRLNYELPEGNRVFTRKAQFQYGWDWGPKLNVVGIWRPIELVFSNEGRIRDLAISNHQISDSLAVLNLSFSTSNTHEPDLEFEVLLNNEPVKTLRDTFPSLNRNLKLNIKNPQLWWPHNIGDPYLYDIKVVVKDDNTVLDTLSTKYGIREVELVTDPDSLGTAFYFKINGVPVYAKGANYIPQHSFQNNVKDLDYVQLLNDVVDANMNMLRVWGGGIYEDDLFYELCDEKGIMVWQDFMFACAMYPGDEEFLSNVKEEAIDNVSRLRDHASIVLWCGNNENSEGWHRWGWQDGRPEEEKLEIWNNYIKVFDSLLPQIVGSYTNVPYWESSPKFGRGNPQYEFEGDAHDWWVWHDGYPFEHFEAHVPRFMSEFGFQSFPSEEVINLMNDSDSLQLNTDAVINHQKHSRGFQLIDQYMTHDFPVLDDPQDYIYMSQLVQAYGITKGIEAHRRAKPYNMGSLFWQLNDCWPAISWSSIDFLGHWKALHYKAKQGFENVLISPKLNDLNQLEIWLINDGIESQTGILALKILDFYGNTIFEDAKPIKMTSLSNDLKWKLDISSKDIDRDAVVVEVTFKNQSRLFYLTSPKDLKLPQADITITSQKVKEGFEITMESAVLQKDVYLSADQEGHFKENFIDILPNQLKTILFECKTDSITGLQAISFNNFIR